MSVTADDAPWMPTNGRHPVTIGGSLLRALKARKTGTLPPAKISKEFYGFRYVSRPETVDMNGSGTVELTQGEQTSELTVERSSTRAPGEMHVFHSTKQRQDELECVLFYDEETGAFTLEKIDTRVMLAAEYKTTNSSARSPRPPFPVAAAPVPAPAPPPPPKKPKTSSIDDDLLAQIEREMRDAIDVSNDAPAPREEGEEPSDGEIPPTPPAPTKPPRPVAHAAPKASAPKAAAKAAPANTKAGAKSKQKTREAPEPSVRAPAKIAEPAKPSAPPPTSFGDAADEEVIDFSLPPPPRPQPVQTKRAPKPPPRRSPPPAVLALPGSLDAATVLPPPVLPPQPMNVESDEDEENWIEVPPTLAVPQPVQPAYGPEIEMEEEEDINELDDLLRKGLEEQMDEDDEPAVEAPMSPDPSAEEIMPLNELAGGLFSEEDSDTDDTDDTDED